MNKTNKKGFTLAELLIVVAIIAVLVAIAIPVFTAQLEKSREAVDAANIRASYAQIMADAITSDESVDIDADKTRITTSAISIGLNPESIVGIIESYPLAATSISSEKRRPNPPRK